MSREYGITVRCIADGCNEFGHYSVSSRKDERDTRLRYEGKWRCTRHTNPEQLLSPTNTRRVTEITADKSVKYPDLVGLFWSTGSWFAHGLGWKAYANDFPPGSRIRVTVEVLLPDDGGEIDEVDTRVRALEAKP